MTGVELPQDQKQKTNPFDICHVICDDCYPNWWVAGTYTKLLALCGTDVTDEPFTPNAPEESECVMCVETEKMNAYVCPVCGL